MELMLTLSETQSAPVELGASALLILGEIGDEDRLLAEAVPSLIARVLVWVSLFSISLDMFSDLGAQNVTFSVFGFFC